MGRRGTVMGRRGGDNDRNEGRVMWARGTVQHNQMADHLLSIVFYIVMV